MKKFICVALCFVLLLSMVYVSPFGIQTVYAENVSYSVTGGYLMLLLQEVSKVTQAAQLMLLYQVLLMGLM